MPTPQRDLEETGRALLEWFATRLPDAEDIRMSELTGPSNTGFSNDTLLFDLEWQEAGTPRREGLVVRIEPTGFQIFPEYDVGRQLRVMQLLAGTEVPVPRMFWLEEETAILGAPFFCMERIEGRIPSDNPPYHTGGWITEISPSDRARLWWDGLDVLTRIHRLDWRGAGFDFLEEPGLTGSPTEHQLRYYRRFLTWAARGRPQPTTEAALEWLEKHCPQREPVALSWGDSRLGNMIFREGRCVAVLDWEMVTLGNPEMDLGWWLFLDDHHSKGCSAPRLDGFPSHEESVATYEARTGLTVRHLEYFKVFAAFRFSVIMIRVGQQLVEAGLLPSDSHFETDNTVTRMLASMLDLPPPA